MRPLTYILRALRSPRKIIQSLSYVINDEVYWDAYVRDWRKSGNGSGQLGTEWKNEEPFLELLTKHASGEHVALEIGSGGGRITVNAASLFNHVYAADISDKMLEQCRKTVSSSNVSFHKLDGFTLGEFPNNSIDLVYSHDVFVHFSFLQVYSYFKDIERVLTPGGRCIISFYDFHRQFDLFKQMSQRYYDQKRYPPHMRVHFVTVRMVTSMLKDLGLELVESYEGDFLVVVCRKVLNGA